MSEALANLPIIVEKAFQADAGSHWEICFHKVEKFETGAY